VRYWLESRGINVTDAVVDRIFERAKQIDYILPDREILEIVEKVRNETAS
jgi:isopropylmalate/homocitrate/citramalate synthase